MSSPHWASLQDWEAVKKAAELVGSADCSVILELAGRLTAAEGRIRELQAAANTPDHIRGTTEMVATDQELRDEFYAEQREDDARRAIYNLGRQHGAANANHPAPPDSSPPAGGLDDRGLFTAARWLRGEVSW